MGLEPTIPKYAVIADALRARMHNGTYPEGAMLPSEAQLAHEFDASRSTVVRALESLRQLGYLQGIQGKGRIVLDLPPSEQDHLPARIADALYDIEIRDSATMIKAGHTTASPRIASALAIPPGAAVVVRQRVMPASSTGRRAMSTVLLSAAVGTGTYFADSAPLREGVLHHLERRRDLIAGGVTERLSARAATFRESAALGMDRRAVVLTSQLTVGNLEWEPVMVIDLVIPAATANIEEAFRLH